MAKKDFNEFYNQKQLTVSSQKGYYKEKVDFFIKQLRKIEAETDRKLKILDIGCNDGALTKKYTKYGEVIGIDINKDALKECRKKKIQCHYGQIDDLDSKYDNFFDVVIAGDIIEHLFDTDNFLRQINRVLNRGGYILLTTPNLASIGRRILLCLGKNPFVEYSLVLPYPDFNVGHIRYYTKKDLLEQLNKSGFQNECIYGDKINFSSILYLPYLFAKYLPSLSRNLMVLAQK